MATGDKVALVVAPAVSVRRQMVQGQLGPIFDALATPRARKAIPKVNRQPLFLTNPVHTLPVSHRSRVELFVP